MFHHDEHMYRPDSQRAELAVELEATESSVEDKAQAAKNTGEALGKYVMTALNPKTDVAALNPDGTWDF